jgi:hypothetical protein
MGTISVGERNKMLDAWSSTTTYTLNANVYVKLHTGDPGAAGTSNAAGHTTRVEATFGAAATGAATTTGAVSFTSLSTAETITHVSFWNHITAGDFLGSDDLPASKAVSIGDTLTIPTGDIDLSLT